MIYAIRDLSDNELLVDLAYARENNKEEFIYIEEECFRRGLIK